MFEYIDSCKVCLHEHDPWTYKKPRENDFFLQQAFLEAGVSGSRLLILNEMRMALRLITASDIVSIGSNTSILSNILNGVNHRESKLEWPRSDEIPEGWAQIWKSALQEHIVPRLQDKPLGKFIQTTHQRWKAFVSEDGDTLQYKNNFYRKGTKSRSPRYTLDMSRAENICFIPADIEIWNDNQVRLAGK